MTRHPSVRADTLGELRTNHALTDAAHCEVGRCSARGVQRTAWSGWVVTVRWWALGGSLVSSAGDVSSDVDPTFRQLLATLSFVDPSFPTTTGSLVGVEVEGQARVVLLDDDAGRLRIEEGGDATSERDCGITTRVFRAGPVVPSPRAGKPTPGDGRREDRVVIHGIRTFLTVLVRTRPMLAT